MWSKKIFLERSSREINGKAISKIHSFSHQKNIARKISKNSNYTEAMLKYGTDKPDLRNPLLIHDITKIFNREDVKFDIFKKLVKSGNIVRAIITKQNKR